MPTMPAAEIAVDETLVRALLDTQATEIVDAATRPLRLAAEGWDNTLWRWGDDLAVRLPRRALAAPLTRHEHEVLPAIAERLAAVGVAVPAPVLRGEPALGYPWHWSIVPWMEGTPGLQVPRADRSPWAVRLAAALTALHVPATGSFPVNPVRGVPLARRDEAMQGRLAALRRRGDMEGARLDALEDLWRDALAAPVWSGPSLWIHGDLHPGNIVARGGELVGLIDFGDVTAGDPAYDLAIAWMAFDASGRAAFVDALEDRVDAVTWRRARGWAAAQALILLNHSDDNPEYHALGREVLTEVT